MIYKTEAGGREVLARYEEFLARWPVPAERVLVPTREGETFVLVSGPESAPPLVLMHGSGANAAMWGEDVAAWSAHFRVLAVDMIGEPGLSAPSRPELGGEAHALWLDDVFDHFGLTRAAVVGASLGGWLAVDHATRRPGRVTALALLCPGGIGRQKYGWVAKALFYKPFGEWGRYRSIKAVAGVDLARDPGVADYLAATFRHFTPRTDRLPVATDAALAALDMPVLAVVGARDAMLDSADTARRLTAHVPGATVVVLPDVAHSIRGQAAPILDFLLSAR